MSHPPSPRRRGRPPDPGRPPPPRRGKTPGPPKRDERFEFCLYVTGATPRSARAIARIRALCEAHLPGRYDLQVIDLYQQPAVAALDQIVAAPTLIRRRPLPFKRIVGDLSSHEDVVRVLSLPAATLLAPPPDDSFPP